MSELWRHSAVEAVRLLKRREVSPLELIDACAARVESTNSKINALVTLCYDRARDHARRIMSERRADPPSQYLHGLPIAVKDGTDVAGVRCTSGSRIYADRIAPSSDVVVQRLEANGAVVIGKTNLPEFAAGGNTFNDVFGATLNPWDVRTTSSGSSGGSAAALAAGQVWLATGGDFGGSIRTPSSYCSTTGLRPSPGMVARTSRQPFNPLSVEGPMARDVADTALMFDAEAGWHPLDPLSQVGPHPSFSEAAARPHKPARVAFSTDLGIARAVDREVRAACRAAAERLARDGVVVEEAHPDLSDAERIFHTLRGAVFVGRHAQLMEKHRHLYKPEIIENTEIGLKLTPREIVEAEIAQGELIRRTARFFEKYDLLICPAVTCPPFDVNQRYPKEVDGVAFEGYMGWLVLTLSITVTACPVMALPGGFTGSGLPIGLQLMGPPRSEAKLISMASYLEALLDVKPKTPVDPR
ncbi:MAG TPA: amidase family protein [Burkholderiales bacterium]|nr:amidase family protein [Burkholderiales bacterium]